MAAPISTTPQHATDARQQQLQVLKQVFEALRLEMGDNTGLRAANATGDVGVVIVLGGGDAMHCVLRLGHGMGSVLSCSEVLAHMSASTPPMQADVIVSCTGNTFERIVRGQLKAALAFFQRKVKITGDRKLLEALRSPVRYARIRLGMPVDDDEEQQVAMINGETVTATDVETKRRAVKQTTTAVKLAGEVGGAGIETAKNTTTASPMKKEKGRNSKRPKATTAPFSKIISKVINSAAARMSAASTRKRACVACRSSRVKCDCDGTKACSRCTRLGLKCVLAAPKRRGRPTNSNALNKALEMATELQGEAIVFDPASSTVIEGQSMWQSQVRTGACSACRRAKVKCEDSILSAGLSNNEQSNKASCGAGQCQRCARMSLPCVKNSTTPGRPLARHTRALMLPTYAPPDVTTFPGVVVSKSAAQAQVAGAYPILAVDDIVRKFKSMDSRLGGCSRTPSVASVTNSPSCAGSVKNEGTMSAQSSPGPSSHYNPVDDNNDDDNEVVPKTLVYWNCMMLRGAVLEDSRSEVEGILNMASQLGIPKEIPMSCVDSKKVQEILSRPQMQRHRREDESMELPYARPPVPDKLPGNLDELAKTTNPEIATLTVYCEDGKRSGACNARFAELYMTDKQLDGFLLNGLAKPWYQLLMPADGRFLFESLTWMAIDQGDKTLDGEPIETTYTPKEKGTTRDRFGRQWSTRFEMRTYLEEFGKVGCLVMALHDLTLIPRSECIKWPENVEEEAVGYSRTGLADPSTSNSTSISSSPKPPLVVAPERFAQSLHQLHPNAIDELASNNALLVAAAAAAAAHTAQAAAAVGALRGSETLMSGVQVFRSASDPNLSARNNSNNSLSALDAQHDCGTSGVDPLRSHMLFDTNNNNNYNNSAMLHWSHPLHGGGSTGNGSIGGHRLSADQQQQQREAAQYVAAQQQRQQQQQQHQRYGNQMYQQHANSNHENNTSDNNNNNNDFGGMYNDNGMHASGSLNLSGMSGSGDGGGGGSSSSAVPSWDLDVDAFMEAFEFNSNTNVNDNNNNSDGNDFHNNSSSFNNNNSNSNYNDNSYSNFNYSNHSNNIINNNNINNSNNNSITNNNTNNNNTIRRSSSYSDNQQQHQQQQHQRHQQQHQQHQQQQYHHQQQQQHQQQHYHRPMQYNVGASGPALASYFNSTAAAAAATIDTTHKNMGMPVVGTSDLCFVPVPRAGNGVDDINEFHWTA